MPSNENKQLVICRDVHGVESPCSIDELTIRPAIYGLILRGSDMIVIETMYGLTLPGGRIEAGERHEVALKREVFEETNAQVAIGPVCGFDTSFWHHKGEHFHCLSTFFLCSYEGGDLSINNQSDQEREWRCKPVWMPIDTALERGIVLTADWRSALDVALGLRP